MRNARIFCRFSVFLLTVLLSGACTFAQSPIDPGTLPGRTVFYLQWHGTPSGESRKNSSLFALWDDPQFATARASLVDSLMNNAQNQKPKTTLSREEFEEYVKLLDNPFVIGYLRRPESHAPVKAPTEKATPPPAWNGMFFIYDRSGKEQLLSKAVLRMRGAEKDIPKLTELTVAGVPSLKVERKDAVTYWAEFSKYAVSANELPVFEEILNVLNGKARAARCRNPLHIRRRNRFSAAAYWNFFLASPVPIRLH